MQIHTFIHLLFLNKTTCTTNNNQQTLSIQNPKAIFTNRHFILVHTK